MIDLENERVVTLNEARRLPFLKGRRGNATSLCTINRWCGRGVRNVTLESAKIGGTIVTTVEAVLRFVERLNLDDPTSRNCPRASRRRQIEAAASRLDKEGIR